MSKKAKNKIRQLASNATQERHLVREIREISFSGPLPASSEFQKYEEICPGAADRIIKMAEQQASHRHELESNVINSNIDNERLGMWMAAGLTTMLSVFGFILILKGKEGIGIFTVALPAVFNFWNFFFNKKKEREKSKE